MDESRRLAVALPWDDLKVCFGIENPERLWRAVEAGRATFPEGWSLCETDCSGARCVALFRVQTLPVPADAFKVKATLRRFSR